MPQIDVLCLGSCWFVQAGICLAHALQVDEDLEEETAEEAGKYGKVKKCTIKDLPVSAFTLQSCILENYPRGDRGEGLIYLI